MNKIKVKKVRDTRADAVDIVKTSLKKLISSQVNDNFSVNLLDQSCNVLDLEQNVCHF